jgi:hypothetical protein
MFCAIQKSCQQKKEQLRNAVSKISDAFGFVNQPD